MPISRTELENLIERKGAESGVLSVYLEVDQSRAANLNRGFTAALKDRLRAIEQEVCDNKAKGEFQAAAQRALEYVSNHDPHGRTLVLFCAASNGFFWSKDVNVNIPTDVRWDGKPYVRPLFEALDEHESYAVALADRQEARLFTVALGEIREHPRISSPDKRKHISSPGTEHARSQMNIQRKDAGHAHWHLKEVAEALERLSAQVPFSRLVLAGQNEPVRELHGLLQKRLQAMVVASVPMEIGASAQDVLREVQRIAGEVERAGELSAVEELITLAGKEFHAVVSLPRTLEALRLGRIRKLVYAHGYAPQGVQCSNCSSLFPENTPACAYCGGPVQPLYDLMAAVVERVVDSGGEAEDVRDAAAERLKQAGSVGAFLRF
jgi:peptide subunit release factor 1 (eRF1)